MSNGALKIENNQYVDTGSEKIFVDDWFEKQPYVEGNHVTEGLGVSESSMSGINAVLGKVFREVQDASFVSQHVLTAVPGHDVSLHYGRHGCLSPLRPRGTTLTPQRLAATLYNNSGTAIRDIVNILNDPEVVKKAAEIDSDETDRAKSRESIEFVSNHDTDGIFTNVELLNKEARELLELYGDGVVDAVRGLVGAIVGGMLARAELSYESLYEDAFRLTKSVAEKTVSRETKYSTLNPNDLVEMMYRALEHAIPGLLLRLPDEKRNEIMGRIPKKEEVA